MPKNKTNQKQERGGEREKEISLAEGHHKGIYPFSPLLQKGEQRHRLKTRFATSQAQGPNLGVYVVNRTPKNKPEAKKLMDS